MKHYEERIANKVDHILQSITCDKCKRKFVIDDPGDILEIEEMHHIEFRGGFGSVFGDENYIEVDICQYCLYDFIGDCYSLRHI